MIKNKHFIYEEAAADQNWEAPLWFMCFYYYTANLITSAGNICLNASSEVSTEVIAWRRASHKNWQNGCCFSYPAIEMNYLYKVWVNSSAPGLSFDHHPHHTWAHIPTHLKPPATSTRTDISTSMKVFLKYFLSLAKQTHNN